MAVPVNISEFVASYNKRKIKHTVIKQCQRISKLLIHKQLKLKAGGLGGRRERERERWRQGEGKGGRE